MTEMQKKDPSPRFVFRGDDILVCEEAEVRLPEACSLKEFGLNPLREGETFFKGEGRLGWAEVAPGTEPPSGMAFAARRQLLEILGEESFATSGRAYHLMDWTRKNQFCGRCGTPLRSSTEELALICPACGHTVYPTIAPAIIVAIEREGKLLLGRSPRFPKGRYSVLAGFVEPGEALEDTVRREVFEEVSVEITDIRYFGSQPWPFPNSLMLGFTARWKSGEIQIDGKEIEDAGWYAPDELPNIPTTRSISGKLIRNFLGRHTQPKK